jgi:ribonuclease R
VPLRFTERIIRHLAHGQYRPSSLRALARDMRVEPDEMELFEEAVRRLAADGRLDVGEGDGVVHLPAMPAEIVGRLKANPRGFGFIVPKSPYREGDLFVPPEWMRDAISGDTVRAAVVRQPWRARTGRSDAIGRIEEVLERGQDQFVGVLVQRGRGWLVEPDGRSLHEAVVIRDPHAKGAKAGDKVVIELVHYPEDEYRAEGVITKVLGPAGEVDVETKAVIEAHGLREEFPPEAIHEAQEAARSLDVAAVAAITAEREDLTGAFVFTIDPPDARDFDDAISIERHERDGRWTLGVHIADVAHFVRRGGPLDREAMARGNSVYLPRHVIPMLPEVLSNGVCSLQEGVARLTKSVFITFDDRGRVLGQRLAATVIRSAKRLTYLEAQALIDGEESVARQHARTEPEYSEELVLTLRLCDRLARILRERRMHDGMIVLDLPEVELVFDEDGAIADAAPEDDAFTHKVIEMFMVEANEAVARTFDSLGVPLLRRIHPDPTFGAIEELRLFARALQLRVPDEPTRQDLQALLAATRGAPAGRALHFAVLRTLAKASYSPAAIGHYALASDHYAHFTSPIRRYPDLTVHRAVEAYLDETQGGARAPGGRARAELGRRLRDDSRVASEDALVEVGRHCSDTEVEAADAERDLRDFLVMRFLQEQHLGDHFPGVVTGIASAGIFVSIDRYLVEGMVSVRELPGGGRGERWRPDHETGRFVGAHGMAIGVGDVVTVQIVAVDVPSRHLDLRLAEMPAARAGGAKRGAKRPTGGRATKGKQTKKKRKGFGRGRRGGSR